MNETTLSVKLAGVKGIVVKDFENKHDKIVLKQAAALSKWLAAQYPDIIKEPPPVIIYNGRELKMADISLLSGTKKKRDIGAPDDTQAER
jgi:hypothetical protein